MSILYEKLDKPSNCSFHKVKRQKSFYNITLNKFSQFIVHMTKNIIFYTLKRFKLIIQIFLSNNVLMIFSICKPELSYYIFHHLYFRLKRIQEVIVVMKPCPVRMNQSMQILLLRSILKRNRRAAKLLRVTVYKRMMNIISKTITKKFNNTFLENSEQIFIKEEV